MIFCIMFSEYACLIITIVMHYRTVHSCMSITVDSVSTGLCISLAFRLMFAWRPTVCFKDTVTKMKLGVSHAFLPRTVIQRGPRGMFKPEDLCCVGVAPLSTIRWQRANRYVCQGTSLDSMCTRV